MSVVTDQPGTGNSSFPMPGKGGVAGLAMLNNLDQLLVRQKVEMCEALTGFEQKNKYQICDRDGQEVYFLREETSCCTRNCCGPQRPFDFFLSDSNRDEVLHLHRDCVCSPCGWPNVFCCLCCGSCSEQVMTVNSFGAELGTLSLERTFFVPTINVMDGGGNQVFTIVSDFCQCSCGEDIEYRIMSMQGEEVGNITKQYNGFCKEVFTDADNFVINFPVGIDMNGKALLLGAALMIDFLFFETKQNDN